MKTAYTRLVCSRVALSLSLLTLILAAHKMELIRIYQYCIEPWLCLLYLYLLSRIAITQSDTLRTPFFRIVTWMGSPSDMGQVMK